MHRPQRPRRLWIRQSTFRSAHLSNIPQSVPSPSGRRSRPRCSTSCTDRKDRVDYGFGKAQSGRRTSQASPKSISFLPPGEGADRGVARHAPTAKTASLMDSAKHFQVGVPLQHPQSVPSPSGRRSRPRRSTSFTDRKDRVDYGFGKAQSGRRTSQAFPNQSPLPPGAGADRGVVRHAPTAKTASIMDSAKHNQVGAPLKHPPIGSPLPPGEEPTEV